MSDDLEGWHEDVKDVGSVDLQVMIARNIAIWATGEELAGVYRARSDFFSEIAGDPSRNRVCAFEGLWDDRVRSRGGLPETLTPFVRVAGRSMARMHEGKAPWWPEVGLVWEDAAWDDFVDHFDGQGLEDVIDLLLLKEEADGEVDREGECLAQAALYGETAENPDLPIGQGRLLDFIRELEILGTEEF